MNRIVRLHYPVDKLPADLREGIAPLAKVTITIEMEGAESAERHLSLEEIFAHRQPPFRSAEDIDRELSQQRDAWDD